MSAFGIKMLRKEFARTQTLFFYFVEVKRGAGSEAAHEKRLVTGTQDCQVGF